MIKEKKCPVAPDSLASTKKYDGEDVKKQLLEDQHEKCYICERKLYTDFEIEHFRSEHNYPGLIRDWSNLFLACRYCNGKKSSSFDDNVYPLSSDVEDEIEQRIDMRNDKAKFNTQINDNQHSNTIKMLDIFYNGKLKIRNIKEERFFDYSKQKMIEFSRIVNNFIMNPTPQNRALVAGELAIDKELLGFKYWMIRDFALEGEFRNEIVWNK